MNGSNSSRILSRLWFVVVVVVAITILYMAKVLFLPLAFAVLFAFILAPVVSWLECLRLPRALAAMIVIFGFAALLGIAAWMLFTQLVAVTNDLPTYRDNITQKMEAIHSPSDSAFSRAQREVQHLSEELGLANSSAVLQRAPGQKASGKQLGSSSDRPIQVREVERPTGRLDQLGGILEPLTTSFLCVVFTFFVLLQREDLRNRLIHLSGDRNLSVMTQAMRDASARISRYFSLQLLVNLTYGVVVFLALYVIGLPHAVLFGSLAGLLRFVPYLGAPIAAMLPTVLSLAVFHGWRHTAEIVAVFLVLEVFTANYAEPHIYGKHTGLSSLAILIAAAFWTLIWGTVGLILSVPLTVCLVVMGSHIPALGFLTVMLGDKPSVSPATCYYQRLLAHDEREAGEILDTCLKDTSLKNIYDSVLVPALIMSEQDRVQGDLEEDNIAFIRRTTRELIDELGFRAAAEHESDPDAPETPRPKMRPVKVLCVPVRDETDELGAIMLAQLLEEAGAQANAVPVLRADEILAAISNETPDLVFLAGLPPFGMARAQRLYRGVHTRFSHLPVLLGIWGYTEDTARAAQKISRGDPLHISTNLAAAVEQVRTLAGTTESLAAPEPTPASAA
jgi:predicted PurR-regulated permease PerM